MGNKEHNSDPVVVQVPPPPEIAEALKHEAGDILSVAQSMRGIKRERDSLDDGSDFKRSRFEAESEPSSDDFIEQETSSERDLDREVEAATTVSVPVPSGQTISADFTIPNIQTDISGLEDILSSEMFGPLIRLSPPPTEKDYCYNLDNSEGVCDLFDVL